MYALKITELEKKYGNFQALKGITLQLTKGTIFGLLGPNGAGKSTFIKTLVGALMPTKGMVEVLGLDPIAQKKTLRKKIGYMPQSSALYEDLSAYENIYFFGKLQNVENLEEKIKEILVFTELANRANDPVYTFSGGMKKRVSLACALLHDPELIFLDEPTAAVDPHLKLKTWELFKKLTERGITLVVSTHLMDEALLCDSVGVLYQGKLVANDTPDNLMQKGKTYITIQSPNGTTEKIIDGKPDHLAKTLHQFGLNDTIHGIEVNSDSLETIILRLLERKKGK